MESSNEGRHKSVKLINEQEPIASTSTSTVSKEETKVGSSSSKGQVDSPSSGSSCPFGEKAMGISLILQCVISKMSIPTLKISRLVSKTWKVEADKEIKGQDCFRLKFQPETRPLNEGLKELEFSKDLPCYDFHLSISKDDDGLAEIKKFISLFGSRVKSLTLNSKLNKKSLLILLTGVPNLEKLFLSYEFTHYNRGTLILPVGALSNLKHLTYLSVGYPKILEIYADTPVFEIIRKAPNLQSINNAVFENDLLLASNVLEKIHLLKSFEIRFDNFTNYLNSGLKVETLLLFYDEQQEEMTRKIIDSSQDTLETLYTTSRFICLPKEDGFGPFFLPFQNLKVLQIEIDVGMFTCLAYYDYASEHLTQFCQEAFPSLSTVVLELPSIPSRYLGSAGKLNFVPFKNSIKSVVNLELRGQRHNYCNRSNYWEVDENQMLRVKQLFPNVKNLKLKHSSKIPQILPFCFANWPELESLQIHINFKQPHDMPDPFGKDNYFQAMKQYENLDSVFTGLPVEIYQRLEEAKPGKELEEDNQVAQDIHSKQRSKDSLVSLTELKKLDIVFDDIRPRISETNCPISSVSCLYAFKLMENLKVRVLYDQNLAVFKLETRKFEDQCLMKKYLKELAPHVEFGHWENGGVASCISAEIPVPGTFIPGGFISF